MQKMNQHYSLLICYSSKVQSAILMPCPLCNQTQETSTHLICHCRFSVKVWCDIVDWFGLPDIKPREWSSMGVSTSGGLELPNLELFVKGPVLHAQVDILGVVEGAQCEGLLQHYVSLHIP